MAEVGARYGTLVEKTVAAVSHSPGHTSPLLRKALVDRSGVDVPENLKAFLEKVTRHAYQVTDDDVDALKRAGYDEDEIFELTASAAVGAALLRLNRGLAALMESR